MKSSDWEGWTGKFASIQIKISHMALRNASVGSACLPGAEKAGEKRPSVEVGRGAGGGTCITSGFFHPIPRSLKSAQSPGQKASKLQPPTPTTPTNWLPEWSVAL